MCETGVVHHRFSLPVLTGRHTARYGECDVCRTLQVSDPDWLGEAYDRDDELNAENLDSGRWLRNFSAYSYLAALRIAGVIPASPRILDFGGGHGLLTQLLIDSGWDAWTHDPQIPNPVFASHRTLAAPDLELPFDVVVALEVFEHLVDVHAVGRLLRSCLKPNGLLVISTAPYEPAGHDETWDYLATEAGQHVTLWSRQGLARFARRYGFRSVAQWPGAEGFLILMSPLPKDDVGPLLDAASDALGDGMHTSRITHHFDFRHVGVIREQRAIVDEIPPPAEQCGSNPSGRAIQI